MMTSSDRKVIAFDHSKFGKSALNLFSPLSAFDRVFVPSTTDGALVAGLERAKVNVERVPMAAPGTDQSSIVEGRFR
jgi:DeoR/GlpR family transcriptional regulator of sugar metabolism